MRRRSGGCPPCSEARIACLAHAPGRWRAQHRLGRGVLVGVRRNPLVAGLAVLACVALFARGEATARASRQAPTALLPRGERSGDADVAVDARGTVFVVWSKLVSARTGESFLMAQERPAGGAWQRPVRISGPGVSPGEVELVSDARGDEAVTWEQSPVSENKWTVVAARRLAGGAWSAPARLPPPGVEGRLPIAAIGASGSVVVAWSRSSHSDPASQVTEAV